MKKYELKYTPGEEGVFCMSIVENPATKTQLVFMSDDEVKLLEFKDDEKQVIYSVAMRPGMLIPRKNINGEPAMVFYSEETVRDLQQNFFKNNSHNGSTIGHDKNVRDNIFCFESWIVEDPEKDKAATLGLDVKKGDWVLGQKIDNAEVWEDVKSGKLTGFSIEAYLEPVLTNENEEIQMTKEEHDQRVRVILMEDQSTPYEVGDKKYFIDKMEVGGKVKDPEANPVANAEIEVNKWKIKTDENGVITEAVEEIENADDPAAGDDAMKKLTDENEALKTENNDLKAKITELESKQTNMSAELADTKKIVVSMAEEAKKGLGAGGDGSKTEKPYHEMSNLEKARYNRGK